MGIREYIEQQLRPEPISDARTEDKVSHLASLSMSQDEIFDQYPATPAAGPAAGNR